MSVIDREAVVRSWLPSFDAQNHLSNYASLGGHPCDRYLTLVRTNGQEALPPDEVRLGHMKRGKVIEDIAIKQLTAAGYEVYLQQLKVEIVENGDVLWRGKIEGVIRDPRKGSAAPVHPLEVKSTDERTWERCNSVEDLRSGYAWWTGSYVDQLLLYMYQKAESETGILCLIHPRTLLPKYIEVPMDYERVQELLDRARRVNTHLKLASLPEPIPWSRVCETCDLLHVCVPKAASAMQLKVWEEPEFEERLNRREALKADLSKLEREYKALDQSIKGAVPDGLNVVCGDFYLSWRDRNVKGYTVEPRTDHYVEVRRTKVSVRNDEEDAA